MSRESLDSLIRKLVAEGASRDSIWRMLESKLSEAEKRGAGGSPRCQRMRRMQFFLRTRLVPRNTNAADMAVFRILQHLR